MDGQDSLKVDQYDKSENGPRVSLRVARLKE